MVSQRSHLRCSSQKMVSLLRCDACHVKRTDAVRVPIVVGGPAIEVRLVGPGVRIAGVLVGPHVGDVGHIGLVPGGREVPQPVPLDRAADAEIEL